MIKAPETPSTQTLRKKIPTPKEAELLIPIRRKLVSEALLGKTSLLIAGIGQCSTTQRDVDITKKEATENQQFMIRTPRAYVLQRQNHWKPRSPRSDGSMPWFGMETTDPEAAYQLHIDSLANGTSICTELAYPEQTARYAGGLVMAWIGARNTDLEHILDLAIRYPSLPIGYKNALDGSTDVALKNVAMINTVRANTAENPAPAVLLYRGGTDLDTPQKWEDDLKRTLGDMKGVMMLDLAHGSEQAHDPNGNFKKSSIGQIKAMEHYIKICEQASVWANAVMLEASDAPSETDPNMPHQVALDGIAHIAQLMHPVRESPAKQHFDSEFPDESFYY